MKAFVELVAPAVPLCEIRADKHRMLAVMEGRGTGVMENKGKGVGIRALKPKISSFLTAV